MCTKGSESLIHCLSLSNTFLFLPMSDFANAWNCLYSSTEYGNPLRLEISQLADVWSLPESTAKKATSRQSTSFCLPALHTITISLDDYFKGALVRGISKCCLK